MQWITAGAGIQHSEMFPLLDPEGPNPLEMFQIWLNLPPADKLVDPHFTMFWADDVPVVESGPDGGPRAAVTVIAGTLDGVEPPAPPPGSWASGADSDVAIWHVRLEPGATWMMPPAGGADTARMLYVFDGTAVRLAGSDHELTAGTGAVLRADVAVDLASDGGAESLVLQGRPIGEPVARYGPFVMNTRAEIQQAVEDYRRTAFGGWPWPDDDPTHPADRGRFARHADGRVEEREPTHH